MRSGTDTESEKRSEFQAASPIGNTTRFLSIPSISKGDVDEGVKEDSDESDDEDLDTEPP